MKQRSDGFKYTGVLLGVLLGLALVAGCGLLNTPPALALVDMNQQTINHALTYGLKKQGQGYEKLLGPNWQVHPETGTLLNVYTPYMVLAAKAYKSHLSRNVTPAILAKVKERTQREVLALKDPHIARQIKFVAVLTGPSANFAQGWTATLTGFGHGRDFVLKPQKSIRPVPATYVGSTNVNRHYEAICAYYFNWDTVAPLQGDFQLTLSPPATQQAEQTEAPIIFTLNNDELF